MLSPDFWPAAINAGHIILQSLHHLAQAMGGLMILGAVMFLALAASVFLFELREHIHGVYRRWRAGHLTKLDGPAKIAADAQSRRKGE